MTVCFGCALAHAGEAERILSEAGVQGGLVVVLGWPPSKDLSAFCPSERFLVHGLSRDAPTVAAIREQLQAKGGYGPVSADVLTGARLPYVDQSVNLLMVIDDCGIDQQEMERVLVPGGVLYRDGKSVRKVWEPALDDWSHYLHDADGNAVGYDRQFGDSRHVQWMNGPAYTRFHEKMSSLSAMVTANGKLFYIMDEAPAAFLGFKPQWRLTARDAFNGLTLWQREIENWQDWMTPFKSGPSTLPRRLVAVKDRVFVALGVGEPVRILDANTGRTLLTLAGSENTEELVIAGGIVFSTGNPKKPVTGPAFQAWKFEAWFIKAFDAQSGKLLWEKTSLVYPLSMAADADRLYFCDVNNVVALDAKNGREVWRSDPVETWKTQPLSWHGSIMVVVDGVVLFSGGKDLPARPGTLTQDDSPLYAFDAATGKKLWQAQNPRTGHGCPKDILVIDGVAYVAETADFRGRGYIGYDLKTGKQLHTFSVDKSKVNFSHQRCYRAKATGDFILAPRTGTELVDTQTGEWTMQDWVRGACLYGILPSYNTLYVTPHPCSCFIDHKLIGFNALRHSSPPVEGALKKLPPDRLEKGPAYDLHPSSLILHPLTDWPTYRHNNTRGGATPAGVPDDLRENWRVRLGGKLSAPTVANGKLFVADVDAHCIVAIETPTGKRLWRFTAGGRIDSPPTIHRGFALFGCRDGYIYAVQAADGQLAWRFRAAPADLRVNSYEQLESVWPVHGSVLVRDDTLYAVAGRSMFLDGGLRLVMLDPMTGELKGEKVYGRHLPNLDTTANFNGTTTTKNTALPDIISVDGQHIWMRAFRMKPDGTPDMLIPNESGSGIFNYADLDNLQRKQPHLYCPTGFLDDNWHHRSFWTYATLFPGGAFGWQWAGQSAPSGRILAVDDTHVYGYGRRPGYYQWTSAIEYRLFRVPKGWKIQTGKQKMIRRNPGNQSKVVCDWETDIPLHVRAMVKAGERLIIAGPPDLVDEGDPNYSVNAATPPIPPEKADDAGAAWNGAKGGLLWIVDAGTGNKTSELKLHTIPVFDGMAAARGRLYLVLENGEIQCFTSE